MSMPLECAHEILEASFDGTCTDEERLEFVRLVNDNPEMVGSIVQDAFIHGLLQWHDSSRN